MNSFVTRTLTAIVFATVLIGLVYYSFVSFLLLLSIVFFISLFELKNIFKKAEYPINTTSVLSTNIFLFLFLLYPCFDSAISFYHIFIFVFFTLIIKFLLEFLFKNKITQVITELIFSLYLLIFFSSTLYVFYFSAQQTYDYRRVLTVIFLIWSNDTFAYLTGITLGKHKLMPEVSPKKSIEGFIGGIVMNFVTAFLLDKYFLDNTFSISYDIYVIAFIISVFGTIGDLAESKLKRLAQVKDSGNILPGHGGILDRFDAWFIAIPVIAIYFLLHQFILG